MNHAEVRGLFVLAGHQSIKCSIIENPLDGEEEESPLSKTWWKAETDHGIFLTGWIRREGVDYHVIIVNEGEIETRYIGTGYRQSLETLSNMK